MTSIISWENLWTQNSAPAEHVGTFIHIFCARVIFQIGSFASFDASWIPPFCGLLFTIATTNLSFSRVMRYIACSSYLFKHQTREKLARKIFKIIEESTRIQVYTSKYNISSCIMMILAGIVEKTIGEQMKKDSLFSQILWKINECWNEIYSARQAHLETSDIFESDLFLFFLNEKGCITSFSILHHKSCMNFNITALTHPLI